MRHFKTPTNVIRAIDTDQEFLIEPDWVEISSEELAIALTPTPEQLRKVRIAELKQMLQESDYKVMPDYDKPNEEIKANRQAWREEIRQLSK